MAIGFKELIFHFHSSAPQSQTVLFPGTVTFASAAVKGFDVEFDNGDHNILQEIVRVNTTTTGPTVQVEATLVLRDNSTSNPFHGGIRVLVVAEHA